MKNYEIDMITLKMVSPWLYDNINGNLDNWKFFRKIISSADLITIGKAQNKENLRVKNTLNYFSHKYFQKIKEETLQKNWGITKQSNIYMPDIFFDYIGIKKPKRRKGQQTEKHLWPNITLEYKCYLVTDSINNFVISKTIHTIKNLGKNVIKVNKNDENFEIKINDYKNNVIELNSLHIAIHGIGTKKDKIFTSFRKNIFKSDILYFAVNKKDKIIYIFARKNPLFNKVNNLKYNLNYLLDKVTEESEKSNSKWFRDELIFENIAITGKDTTLTCPVTGQTFPFELATLFRASHIKAKKDCKTLEEKWDLRNGILMCANADAMFDKHAFTIDYNSNRLVFPEIANSKININKELINENHTYCLLSKILVNKDKKYIEHHNSIFYKKWELQSK